MEKSMNARLQSSGEHGDAIFANSLERITKKRPLIKGTWVHYSFTRNIVCSTIVIFQWQSDGILIESMSDSVNLGGLKELNANIAIFLEAANTN